MAGSHAARSDVGSGSVGTRKEYDLTPGNRSRNVSGLPPRTSDGTPHYQRKTTKRGESSRMTDQRALIAQANLRATGRSKPDYTHSGSSNPGRRDGGAILKY